jgi:hypothetical protein
LNRRWKAEGPVVSSRPILSWLLGATLAAASVSASSADAPEQGPLLGGVLEDLCRANEEASGLVCTSYISGSLEGLILGQTSTEDGGSSFCLPDNGITIADVRDTFLHFIGEQTERRRELAGLMLLISLEDRFPCDDEDGDVPFQDSARHLVPSAGARPSVEPVSSRSGGTTNAAANGASG